MAPWKIAPPLRAPIRRFRGRPSLISIRIRRRWLGWPSPTAVLLHRPSQLGLSHIVLGRLCLHSPLPQVLRAILSPLCGGIQNAEPPLRPAGSKRSGGAWCWLPLVNPFSFSKVSATSLLMLPKDMGGNCYEGLFIRRILRSLGRLAILFPGSPISTIHQQQHPSWNSSTL